MQISGLITSSHGGRLTEQEMNSLLHELRCRDEYYLRSSSESFALRNLWEYLPEECEALQTLWGPLFPDDLAGVLVVAFGAGTGYEILNMPLSQAEYERWDAASHAIDGMQVTEAEDD